MAIYRPPPSQEESNDVGKEIVVAAVEKSIGEASSPSTVPPKCKQSGGMTSQSSTPEASRDPLIRNIYKFRLRCGEIVNHPKVQHAIIVLIVVNAIMMGIATFDFVNDDPQVDQAFEITDLVFLIIFTIELGMQLAYHGYRLFMDGWLLFDFVIVVLSWSFASLQIIRAFRVFRALRIITRIETMRNLVAALFDIMPRLGAITALLMLIFYIFGVLFTQLFGDLELSGNYFTRLDYSLFSLFVMMTMEWADVARECMAEIWWAWAPFVAFIMITGFIVFNLIIAVVCDAVAVIENKNDLEPDFFGMYSHKRSANESFDPDGLSHHVANEELAVDHLAERISFVLENQKELLATLELLTRDHLTPAQMATLERDHSLRKTLLSRD
mmetsp:Transcript_21689/g.45626  ORF Transcript_21689/g.45626 Transcript_21689/m.45626 type:complete len:384 (+) Transcript_21689:54-1205(+)